MLRTIRHLAIGVFVAAFFFGLFSVLWVRGAVDQGALNQPWTCLNYANFNRYKAGKIEQGRIDGILAMQIRKQHLAGRRVGIGTWHLVGGFAQAGVLLGYSADARRRMAMEVISRASLCRRDEQRYRELHLGTAAG